MSTQRDYAWLPDHQLHLSATLAHADDLLQTMADVLLEYVKPDPGPFDLKNVVRDGIAEVVVVRVRPLPSAVASYSADALTVLRGAIEHAMYAEVEYLLGRRLVGGEQRMIEMPACTSWQEFSKWLGGRKKIAPFADRAFVNRIEQLQPYQRRNMDEHPMKLLAAHTNFSKHRAPAVATTRLGVVIPEYEYHYLATASKVDGGQPVTAGDVIASGPADLQVPLQIWPQVSIQRPHTGTWHVLMSELGDLEEWVRCSAIPILVTGSSSGLDRLPPQLNTRVGHADLRESLRSAGSMTARERSQRVIAAEIAREGLVRSLAGYPSAPAIPVLERWAASLTDDEILERHNRLGVSLHSFTAAHQLAVSLISEAERAE